MSSDLRELLERAKAGAPPAREAFERLERRRGRKARNGRLLAAVVALAVSVAGIGGALLALRGRSEDVRAPRSGEVVIGTPTADLSVAPGEYVYAWVRDYSLGGYDRQTQTWYGVAPEDANLELPFVVRSIHEYWYGPDASGRTINVWGEILFFTEADREAYVREVPSADRDLDRATHDRSYTPGEFLADAGDVTYLSTDAAELEGQLRQRMEAGGASPEPYTEWGSPGPGQEGQEGMVTTGLVRSIGELLRDQNVLPEQKAALFRVAAGLQGMEVVGNATDSVGRSGTLLRIETEGQIHEWWFDPASQQLLAMRDSDAATGQTSRVTIVGIAGVAASTESADLDRVFFTGDTQGGVVIEDPRA